MPRISQFCLNNQLYVPGWSLSSWYRNEIISNDYINHIFVAVKSSTPVGVLVIRHEEFCYGDHNSGTFVKSGFRRRGIGRSLIRRAERDGVDIIPWTDDSRAYGFYANVLGKQLV